jgi:hypothetical protein
VVVGLLIAVGGFFAVSFFEVEGQPTIVNNYALWAFLTVGVFGGLAYWLVAGRRAGGRRGDRPEPAEPAARVQSGDSDREPAANARLAGAAS